MLVLLPPSETKRPGGRRTPLDLPRLALPELTPQRELVIAALSELSSDPDEAARVLKINARQQHEIAANASVRTGPTLPAVDRYTGVVYDALHAGSLDPAARRWLGRHVLIHAAAFGPIGALDKIPTHRLGATANLPGLPPLRRIWAEPVAAALLTRADAFVLDLRSEAYVALGPVPAAVASAYVRVVTTTVDGTVRSLNHFNKAAKGTLVRALAQTRPSVRSLRGLLRWAGTAGIALTPGSDGELLLHVGVSAP